MVSKDYDEVYQIWISTPGMGLNTVDDSYEGIKRFIKRNPTTCFVAREEGLIVGVILCGHDGRRGSIYHTTVIRRMRNQGIATKLVEYACDALKKEGITKVSLITIANNVGGNMFWEKMGFTLRDDIFYRNQSLVELTRLDT